MELQAGSYHSEKDGAFSNTTPPCDLRLLRAPARLLRMVRQETVDVQKPNQKEGKTEKKKKRKRDAHPFIMVIEE